MKTKLVNYNLPTNLIEAIEDMSTGNKTALVISLLNQSIAMRKINDQTRHFMYEGAKKSPSLGNDHVSIKNVINGLFI